MVAAHRGTRAAWLRAFIPTRTRYRYSDFLRGGVGGCLGIIIASLIGKSIPGGPAALPFIVAPIGASAVLVFAAPASPLAQPWSVLGGNMLSAAVGVGAARIFDDPMIAAAVAVGAAILAMMTLGCLHPPGGACALFAAVGAKAIKSQGFAFALWPVGANTAALLVVAIVVNNLTGRSYPHVPESAVVGPSMVDKPPTQRLGVRTDDVEAAMARLDQGLDILPADVVALIRNAEQHALDRRLGELRVGAIMARDVQVVDPADSLYRARTLMNQHHLKALPVVSADRKVLGIVSITDLFNRDVAELGEVASVMTPRVATVLEDSPVADLVQLMSDLGFRHVPVTDRDGRLVGIVTRSELIAVLHRALLGGTSDAA